MIIEPVTRIEGNAVIEVRDGKVYFKVLEFRGFEKFLEGRSFEYVPMITARICGICPVAHAVASARAIENAFGIEISERAEDLRRVLLLAQTIQSHALHLFFLALPDYFKSDSFVGVPKDLVSLGIELRKIANKIVESIAVRPIHPEVIVGGVARDISKNPVDDLRTLLNGLVSKINDLNILKEGEVLSETAYLSLNTAGKIDFYGETLKGYDGEFFEFKPEDYGNYIEEKVESYSFTKFPYLKGKVCRVGPLARLNLTKVDTDIAREMSKEFKNIRHETLLYNYARLVEIVYCLEKTIEILENVRSGEIRQLVKPREGVGIGVVEAPRGTLIHHYEFDNKGLLRKANLIVPTTINNTAINQDLNVMYKKGREEDFEKIVRAYDPCLSCSTH
ncbi:Ni/Fe hydrogenase subunit alpha [Archaeoglobus sp.]